MRKIQTYALLFLIGMLSLQSVSLIAQPQAINYQGVARDNAGSPMANKQIGVKFTIRSGGSSGIVQYAESNTTSTNQFGLYNIQIGKGSPITGVFSNIPWSSGNQWLQVDIDINGGTNYQAAGSSELLSVP